MGLPLTDFTLFKNTPFTSFENTIHFKSNEERDNFFLKGGKYETISFSQPFHFISDRLTLYVNKSIEEIKGVNYCTFKPEDETTRYYAYIMKTEYDNEHAIRLDLVIDPVMTYTQGKVLNEIGLVTVIREHLDKKEYERYLPILKTNDDVLKTTTKKYVYQKAEFFSSYMVVFQSSADLSADFGTVDNPKITTSTGAVIDGVTSPVNVYVTPYNEFNNLMDKLKGYAWIGQTIQNTYMIPEMFIDKSQLKKVTMKKGGFTDLYTFKENAVNKQVNLKSLKMSLDDIFKNVALQRGRDDHLFRNEYVTLELYTWGGHVLELDPALLDDDTGIEMIVKSTIGNHNEIAIYPKNYQSAREEKPIIVTDSNGKVTERIPKGSFLNTAIIFKEFTQVPTLIDNYNLALSQSAYQRELADKKTLSGRIKNITDPKADLQSRFYDSLSVMSNLSPTSLLSAFSSDYDYYERQKAEFNDLALSTPTIQNQSLGNAFQISHEIYGVTLKISRPSRVELNRITNYYREYGFQMDEEKKNLSDVESMTKVNYVRFKGNWTLPGVDTEIMEQLRVIMESGVKLWHNQNVADPTRLGANDNKLRG